MDCYSIAQKLYKTSRYQGYLSEDEKRVFEYMIESLEVFDRVFAQPSVLLSIDSLADIFEDSQEKIQMILARILTMIVEQRIPLLFPHNEFISKKLDSLVHDIESKDEHLEDSSMQDYDSLIPIEDMYFSLEHDAELLPKLHLFKEVEEEKVEPVERIQPVEESIDAPTGLKVFLINKYLLLHVKRNSGVENIKYIKKVLNEATPSKSKWANDDRVGQEQLYEALEKVLSGLKNYTEHSLPFLKPVQKRDAPNYYDLIKNPMDLSTMTKKLKSFVYNSKLEFVKDLDLIWSNCLEYNTIPESIYRKHAFAMKRKSAELLLKVPEIQVQNAEGSDVEEGSLMDRDVSVEPSVQSITRNISVEPSLQSIKVEESVSVKVEGEMEVDELESEPDMKSEQQKEVEDQIMVDSEPQKEMSEDQMMVDSEPQLQEMQEDPTYDSCLLTRKWKQVTSKFRAAKLQRMINEKGVSLSDKIGGRSEVGMELFARSLENAYTRTAIRNLQFEHQSTIPTMSSDIQKLYCFPEVFNVGNTFPDCYNGYPKFHDYLKLFFSWENEEPPKVPVPPLPSLSEYDSSYVHSSSQMAACMVNNISELKSIKDVYSKIVSYQIPNHDAYSALPIPDPFTRTWKTEDLPPFYLNEESALKLVNKSCSWIAAHQGFDSITTLSLAALSDVMGEVLMNAGRTLKSFMDIFGIEMDMEEIVLHSLEELGIADPKELQSYINHDIIRYGRKLHDIRRRLQFAWADLEVYWFNQNTTKTDENADLNFNNQSEEFITGTIFEEAGIDVLNLKELGLDISFIPSSLLQQKSDAPLQARIKKSLLPNNEESGLLTKSAEKIPPPPAWDPIDPSKQIGLLSEFYTTLQMVPDGLIEDELKPKSKEAKLLIKYALSGARKRTSTATKKKAVMDPTKISIKTKKLPKKDKVTKKERKKSDFIDRK